jgi:hypothetical protein
MRDQVPSHSRQFRVPFEHERTLHKYMDELLKKGAIEVLKVALQFGHFLRGEEGAAGSGPKGAEATKMCSRL